MNDMKLKLSTIHWATNERDWSAGDFDNRGDFVTKMPDVLVSPSFPNSPITHVQECGAKALIGALHDRYGTKIDVIRGMIESYFNENGEVEIQVKARAFSRKNDVAITEAFNEVMGESNALAGLIDPAEPDASSTETDAGSEIVDVDF